MAAALLDALATSLLLLPVAAVTSYSMAWGGATGKAITLVWFISGAALLLFLLVRDATGGRSPGKKLLGLRIVTANGKPCGLARSLVRNLPLVVPGWNLAEVWLLLTNRDRSGDRLAGTRVVEE